MIQLLHGDCLKLMFDLPDNSVDCVICDMPYGTTACKWDTVLPLDMLWHHYKRICKDDAAIVLNASQPFTTTLINSNLNWFRYEWVWEKEQGTNFAISRKQPLKKHENILVFYLKQPYYNSIGDKLKKPQTVKRGDNTKSITSPNHSKYLKKSVYTHKTKHTILKYKRDRTNKHPTQKPVKLIEYLIKTYTNEGDTVLDNCMGSGTTGVACQNLNRNFIGIELDDKYFQIAKDRIEATEPVPELETA